MVVEQVKVIVQSPLEAYNRAVAAASMSGMTVQAADPDRNRLLATGPVGFPALGDTLYAYVAPMGQSSQVQVTTRSTFVGDRSAAALTEQFLQNIDFLLSRTSGAAYEGGSTHGLRRLEGALHPPNPSSTPFVIAGIIVGLMALTLGIALASGPFLAEFGWYLGIVSAFPFLGVAFAALKRFGAAGTFLIFGGLLILPIGLGLLAMFAGLRARSYTDWIVAGPPVAAPPAPAPQKGPAGPGG